jgi:hypothetical protein
MFERVVIENFRGIERLELEGLRRINLFVGRNNAGKTSVLEALHFAAGGGLFSTLLLHAALRGDGGGQRLEPPARAFFDPRYFFRGRVLSQFAVTIGEPEARVRFEVDAPARADFDKLAEDAWEASRRRTTYVPTADGRLEELEGADRLLRSRTDDSLLAAAALERDGRLDPERLLRVREVTVAARPAHFVPFLSPLGASISSNSLAKLWDTAKIEGRDSLIVDGLRLLEPSLDDVFTIEAPAGRQFYVRSRGDTRATPLGLLGSGIGQMLRIMIALAAAPGGYLLIDDLDAGLHHTAIRDMWRLLIKQARALDVTVFATTHSRDGVDTLASLAVEEGAEDLTLTRIERGNPRGVLYPPETLATLASMDVESR